MGGGTLWEREGGTLCQTEGGNTLPDGGRHTLGEYQISDTVKESAILVWSRHPHIQEGTLCQMEGGTLWETEGGHFGRASYIRAFLLETVKESAILVWNRHAQCGFCILISLLYTSTHPEAHIQSGTSNFEYMTNDHSYYCNTLG